MKKTLLVLALLLLPLATNALMIAPPEPETCEPQETYTLMTFNVRVDTNKDTGNKDWDYRKDSVVEIVDKGDIVGLQEPSYSQLSYIDEQLPDYSWVGEGRSEGNLGEFNPIFYDTTKFELLDSGTEWLSNGKIPRIYTWAKFKDCEDTFYVFNTHLSKSAKSRNKSIKKLLTGMEDIAGSELAFLTGDMNAKPASKSYNLLTNQLIDTQTLTTHLGPKKTYTGWKKPKKRIDYIFVNQDINVTKHRTIVTEASDHYAVKIKINK